jgi:farnesyl diphosphate synthase
MPPIATSPASSSAHLPPAALKDKKAAARKRFEAVYTVVRDDLLEDFRKHNMPKEAIEYYRRVRPSTLSSSLRQGLTTRQSMDYNVPGGKLNRGLSVVDSVTILKGRELTEAEYFKAAVLGWSVEWVCFLFLPANMTRR